MIYLDSAATSLQKPECVRHAVEQALRAFASPGRGGHRPSLRAAEAVYACREAAADFFGMEDPERVVFTFNATHALNIAIRSVFPAGGTALISGYEHNSVVRPLTAMRAEILYAGRRLFDREAAIEEFRQLIPKADLVVCTHVSNVFGYILPVYEIGKLCREYGVPYIVDASQSAGVLNVDMKTLGAQFVCMPGHKGLMGPQGTGLLLCRERGEPMLYGGSGSDSISRSMPDYLPDRLEAGTLNACGIAGLLAGLNYVKALGTESILRHERKLCRQMAEKLRETAADVYFTEDFCQCGVLSFRDEKIDSELLAQQLDERGICARAGLHCAPLAHQSAGTFPGGTVRLSFSPFIDERQTGRAAEIIKQIIN